MATGAFLRKQRSEQCRLRRAVAVRVATGASAGEQRSGAGEDKSVLPGVIAEPPRNAAPAPPACRGRAHSVLVRQKRRVLLASLRALTQEYSVPHESSRRAAAAGTAKHHQSPVPIEAPAHEALAQTSTSITLRAEMPMVRTTQVRWPTRMSHSGRAGSLELPVADAPTIRGHGESTPSRRRPNL